MPFKPIHLLVTYDPARGHCAALVPRMKQMLEVRAFVVDVHELGAGTVDLEPYRGVILGTPLPGFGVRRFGPTALVEQFIKTAEGLDEKKVACFCTYDVGFGTTLDRMRNLLLDRGAEVVAEHAYWRLRPEAGEHIIPAECMIRVR